MSRIDVDEGTLRDVEAGYHLPPSHITDPKIILDLGANVGLTMVDFLLRYPEAFVLGVELDFKNTDISYEAILPFGTRAQVVHGGIWDRDGYCEYVGDHHNAYRIHGDGKRVRTFTLDSFIDRYLTIEKEIDFTKFDIEGSERDVFKLGGQWTSRIKCLSAELHNYPYEEAAEDLAALGYDNIVKVFDHPTSCLQAWH